MVQRLKFCPRCNTTLRYVDKDRGIVRYCQRCGYEEEVPNTYVQEEYTTEEKVTVIGDIRRIRTMPTIKTQCPKCGYGVAYTWEAQTRSGDESTTQFFRCKKCGHTRRLYG